MLFPPQLGFCPLLKIEDSPRVIVFGLLLLGATARLRNIFPHCLLVQPHDLPQAAVRPSLAPKNSSQRRKVPTRNATLVSFGFTAYACFSMFPPAGDLIGCKCLRKCKLSRCCIVRAPAQVLQRIPQHTFFWTLQRYDLWTAFELWQLDLPAAC